MQGAIVPPPPRVPILFDRALTDVIRSRRTVDETRRRLAEARSIIETLEHPPGADSLTWIVRLDDAIRHLSVVEDTLQGLLDREEGSP